MNISEAQNISIVGYLSSLGITPATSRGVNEWYCSPLRPGETKPSFKVNTRLNRWVDFGGEDTDKGDIIDLIRKLHGVTIPDALKILSDPKIVEAQYFFFRGNPSESVRDENRMIITKIQSLQNQALIQYIEGRGISRELAGRYCKEVYFNLTNPDTGEVKKFFSIAFENDGGGYAMRNRYFKNAVSPATITTIPGEMDNQLGIFEGFVDFLSACQYFKVTKPKNTIIVLNSCSHIKKIYPLLSKYERVNLYLDNDPTGKKAANDIKQRHSRVNDYSKFLYPVSKDFNEFLISNLKTNKP